MKIAVIGYGSIGRRHVENLLSIPGIHIIICTNQKIKNPSKKKIHVVNSISACLNEKPDAAIICNVTNLHVKTAIQFVHSDIDVFIEKPLSNSITNIENLTKEIFKKKLITQIGCNFRFHKCLKKIKELIEQNKIGKILSVQVENGSFLPDWHPYEDYKKSYSARNDLGGGVVLTCIHEIDYLYWMFGDISEVFSFTGKFSNLKITSDDLSSSILKFKNNIIAELHLDYFQKPDSRNCKIIGTNGVIYWDSHTNIVKLFDFQKNKWINILKWSNYNLNQMYKDEILHFIQCVKQRKTTINPLETDGYKTLKIALAIIKSSQSKRMIKL